MENVNSKVKSSNADLVPRSVNSLPIIHENCFMQLKKNDFLED